MGVSVGIEGGGTAVLVGGFVGVCDIVPVGEGVVVFVSHRRHGAKLRQLDLQQTECFGSDASGSHSLAAWIGGLIVQQSLVQIFNPTLAARTPVPYSRIPV
jgi:hypothetical protein